MKVRANAKINLFLDIVERRPDGYHTLDTVMQSISLCDEIDIQKDEEISFFCDENSLQNENNLCVRSAKLFFAEKKIEGGARITLEKNIPSEAGLGGGSADAAAVLYLLNQLYNNIYNEDELLALALKLGADVPFCLVGGCLRAGGVGEQFCDSFKMGESPIIIVKPPFGISTKDAFSRFDGKKSGYSGDEFSEKLKTGIENCSDFGFNIFEKLSDEYQEIEAIKQELKESGAFYALMSGSGSCVYGIFKDTSSRDKAALKLAENHLVYKAEFAEKGIFEI